MKSFEAFPAQEVKTEKEARPDFKEKIKNEILTLVAENLDLLKKTWPLIPLSTIHSLILESGILDPYLPEKSIISLPEAVVLSPIFLVAGNIAVELIGPMLKKYLAAAKEKLS